MKNIQLWLIILTCFTSCTYMEDTEKEDLPLIHNKDDTILPLYSANPYDDAGKIYDEVFSVYFDGSERNKDLQSIISDVETIANANQSFQEINTQGYSALSPQRISYLSNQGASDIPALIGASGLSGFAKSSFSNFLISVVALCSSNADAVTLYNEIVKYEDEVLQSNLFTSNDTRIILTTTSIIKYNTNRAKKKPKKNKDPDWIIFITHIIGAEEGAEECKSKAIVQSLVCGIYSNQ